MDTFRVLPHVGALAFPLVAVANYGFVEVAEGLNEADPASASRVIQGLITGVGFIGGGAILKQGGEVHGTATAAALWATGAIGRQSAWGLTM